jgi:predicted transcriptional regulator
MILDEDEALTRLNSENNLCNILKKQREDSDDISFNSNRVSSVEVLPMPQGGRKAGDKAIPPMVRELLGSLAVSGSEPHTDIAKVFGVSQPTVSNSARGLIGDRFEEDLEEKVSETKERKKDKAHELALDSLLGSLGIVSELITTEAGLTATKAMRIAKDASQIISTLEGKDKNPLESNVKVVLYAPTIKQENHYEVLDA